ncbi:hypothetical protein PG984_013591 [Apiospora sp. TS-2023a]
MTTFPQFTRLAPELRQMIWDSALENEAENRIVLVHRDSLRVVPSKSLISPLKSVNKESRKRALEHYNVKIDIGIFPAPSVTSVINTWNHRVYSTTYAEVLLNGPINGNSKGCIYVSLGTDKFLLSFATPHGDCVTDLFRYVKVVEDPGSTAVYKIQQPCVGPKLSPAYCSMITSIVYKRHYPDAYYPRCTVRPLWMAHHFTKLGVPTADAKFLTLDNSDVNGLTHTLLHEGAKSLNFTEWQIKDDNNMDGGFGGPLVPKSG